jgi:hypothetical protein
MRAMAEARRAELSKVQVSEHFLISERSGSDKTHL